MDCSAEDAAVLMSVPNRQKVSALHLGKNGTEFMTFLGLGVAIAQNGAAQIAPE